MILEYLLCRLYPDQFFGSDETYDFVINVDSLTELGHSLALKYLRKFSNTTRNLISIMKPMKFKFTTCFGN